MGALCDPPLSLRECLGALTSGYKTRRPKVAYRTIADQLDVTPAEAEIVSQVLYGDTRAGDGRFFPPAQRFGHIEPITNSAGGDTRRTKRFIRRHAISMIVKRHGRVLSVREMQKELLVEGGIESSLGGLHTDYKALELISDFTQGRENTRASRKGARETLPLFTPS
jgi:hypothetical protein